MAIHAGQRVRHWRELRGVSQQDLARDADIEPARLCRIELGKTQARVEEIERLARALTLTMPEFYGALDEAKAS